MCGICGVFQLDGSRADIAPALAMRERLVHRGPDDAGEWSSGPAAFAFRRLSILDLSGGHQPMSSPDGRLTVVFNGEIYNHPRLRSELESRGAAYRTRSDTESVLHLYAREGRGAFRRLEGMFAVALWDADREELVLARDPFGIKPLYYSEQGPRLLFASELRALLTAGVSAALEPSSISEYLSYGCVRAPRTALSRIRKLPPGHLLRAGRGGLRVERYWEPPGRFQDPAPRNLEEASEQLDALLTGSVRGQMISDVPLGAFLSGGVDSSLVVAVMARLSAQPIRTFSIGFSGARRGLDESSYARRVGRYLGTRHEELILPADVLDRWEDLVPCLDEPIADSAILPTFLLARFARASVKVVLTGEGADELFAGYNRYKAAYLSERLLSLPAWARGALWPFLRRLLPGSPPRRPFTLLRDWAGSGALCGEGGLASLCSGDFLGSARTPDPMAGSDRGEESHSLNEALAFDLRTVLSDALLMKVDKATMRASLEARVPFLDGGVANFALRVPANLKMRRFKGKVLLRHLASRYLPSPIAWRRKHGFLVPWEEWVRRSRNPLIDELLAGSALARSGVFDMDRLRAARLALASDRRGADAGLFFRAVVLGLWLESLS